MTLAHPDAQAMKAKWDTKENRRRHDATFEQLFEYFQTNRHSMSAIGKRSGVTGSRVQQIYTIYFRTLFGGLSVRERRHERTVQDRLVKAKQEVFEGRAFMGVVAEKARAAGCTVEAALCLKGGKPTGRIEKHTLLVNGHRCAVHYSFVGAKPSANCMRTYARFNINTEKARVADAVILHSAVAGFDEHLFVIPREALRPVLESPRKRQECVFIFLPTQQLPVYRNIRPRIDWWRYAEGWHLLPLLW